MSSCYLQKLFRLWTFHTHFNSLNDALNSVNVVLFSNSSLSHNPKLRERMTTIREVFELKNSENSCVPKTICRHQYYRKITIKTIKRLQIRSEITRKCQQGHTVTSLSSSRWRKMANSTASAQRWAFLDFQIKFVVVIAFFILGRRLFAIMSRFTLQEVSRHASKDSHQRGAQKVDGKRTQ